MLEPDELEANRKAAAAELQRIDALFDKVLTSLEKMKQHALELLAEGLSPDTTPELHNWKARRVLADIETQTKKTETLSAVVAVWNAYTKALDEEHHTDQALYSAVCKSLYDEQAWLGQFPEIVARAGNLPIGAHTPATKQPPARHKKTPNSN
jgi:regulator of replication initiation timing